MSPIASAVRSSFAKAAKETADITSIVTKIRGEKIKKSRKEPEAEFVSRSEKSYGSMTQNFSDIIDTLEKYGAAYNPANEKIKLPALKDKLAQLIQANKNVAFAFGLSKQSKDQRLELYTSLSELSQRIKDAVKSQYTINSTEYNLIKGLKI